MKKRFKHYISPHIDYLTAWFLGISATLQFIDWGGYKINHKSSLIFTLTVYLISIIADIYFDRLALKKELNELQQNNNGLQQNIKQLESDKKVLQSNLEVTTLINHQLINVIPSDKIKLVNQQIKLIEEMGNIGKTNQNSKNN